MNMLFREPDMEPTSKQDRAQDSVMHEMHEAHSAHADNASAHAGHDPHAGAFCRTVPRLWLSTDYGGHVRVGGNTSATFTSDKPTSHYRIVLDSKHESNILRLP
jgi:hypothetical protein